MFPDERKATYPNAGGRDGPLLHDPIDRAESLIAEEGSESVKPEIQILITETGHLRLDTSPLEEV